MSISHNNERLNNVDADKSIDKKIIDNIKSELKNQKFTYEFFAKLFDKTEGWFSHIMTGRTKLTVKLLFDIAKQLDVDPASLLPNPDNPIPRMSFDEYIWFAIKEKLDKHIDEKLKKIIKKG